MRSDDLLKFCKLVGKFKSLKINSFKLDSRIITPNDCFVCFKGTKFDANDFINQALEKGGVVISSNLEKASRFSDRNNVFYSEDPLRSLKELAEFKRKSSTTEFVTITGATGKTTTKEFIKQILEDSYPVFATHKNQNNLLGVSLALLNMPEKTKIGVIETGTNHFGEVEELTNLVKPNGSVTTNIYPSHLQFFKSVLGVLKAETEQISWLKSNPKTKFWWLNYDDKYLRRFCKENYDFLKFFSMENSRANVFIEKVTPVEKEIGYIFKLNIFRKPIIFPHFGIFNLNNLVCAVSVCTEFLDTSRIEKILTSKSLTLPDFRSTIRKIRSNILVVDCYNSNPGSLISSATETAEISKKFGGKKLVGVISEMAELGARSEYYHNKVAKILKKLGFSKIYFCGGMINQFIEVFGKDYVIQFDHNNLSHLVKELKKLKDCIILLKGSHVYGLERVVDLLEK